MNWKLGKGGSVDEIEYLSIFVMILLNKHKKRKKAPQYMVHINTEFASQFGNTLKQVIQHFEVLKISQILPHIL